MKVRLALPIFLAAVAYVVGGYFVDLPPYGIWLDSSRSRIEVRDGQARVEAVLGYACTSWRPRRTQVYLPFSQDGPVSGVEAGGDARVYADGVVLDLRLQPGERREVRLRFTQALQRKSFHYEFTASRGWPFPPSLVEYRVDGPVGMTFTSARLLKTDPAGEGRARYVLSGVEGEGPLMAWQ